MQSELDMNDTLVWTALAAVVSSGLALALCHWQDHWARQRWRRVLATDPLQAAQTAMLRVASRISSRQNRCDR
jgi:hypothetical protein